MSNDMPKMRFRILRAVFACVYFFSAIWAAGAVYYLGLPDALRIPAVLFFVVLAGTAYFWKRKYLLPASLGLILVLMIQFLLRAPSNDRDWNPSCARPPYAEFLTPDRVKIHDIRDFRYRTETDFDVRYLDMEYEIAAIRHMDYMVVHWDGMEAIAHSMLSFEFNDRRHLTFSIETRTDRKDQFGALPGLYKQFELIFIAGTEEDLIGLRTNYRHEDVYLYRTTLSAEDAQTLFRSLLSRMNRLKEHPEFYNTITKNCLTALIPSVKELNPSFIGDLRLLFNGYSDLRAFESGTLVAEKNESFQHLKQRSYVNPKVDGLSEIPPDFSERIRKK